MNQVVVTSTNRYNKIRIIGAAKANSIYVVKPNPAFVSTSLPLCIHKGAAPSIAIHNCMSLGSRKSLAKQSLGFRSSWERSAGKDIILVMILLLLPHLMVLLIMFLMIFLADFLDLSLAMGVSF